MTMLFSPFLIIFVVQLSLLISQPLLSPTKQQQFLAIVLLCYTCDSQDGSLYKGRLVQKAVLSMRDSERGAQEVGERKPDAANVLYPGGGGVAAPTAMMACRFPLMFKLGEHTLLPSVVLFARCRCCTCEYFSVSTLLLQVSPASVYFAKVILLLHCDHCENLDAV